MGYIKVYVLVWEEGAMFIKPAKSSGSIGSILNLLMVIFSISGGLLPAHTANAAPCIEISSLPVTIDESGKWCLTQDLFLNNANRPAIEIVADNVQLDLQGFTINGSFRRCGNNNYLPLGSANKRRVGIKIGQSREPVRAVTVTNGRIRGFAQGIEAYAENFSIKYLDVVRNAHFGVVARGNGEIKGNRVLKTGGIQCRARAIGINAVEEGNRGGIFITGNIISDTAGKFLAFGLNADGKMYIAKNQILNTTSDGILVKTTAGFTRVHLNRVVNSSEYYSAYSPNIRRGRRGMKFFIPRDMAPSTAIAYSKNIIVGYDEGIAVGFHGDYIDQGGNTSR